MFYLFEPVLSCMVRRGGYRTQAQKEGRSAGQRKRRNLQQRKQKMRRRNMYQITISQKTVDCSHRSETSGMYGIYKTDSDEWILTGLSTLRREEVGTTDRRGATETIVRGRYLVTPRPNYYPIERGIGIDRFTHKSKAMDHISADSSVRLDSGRYLVKSEHNPRQKCIKIDRDKYREFKRQGNVRKVRCEDD